MASSGRFENYGLGADDVDLLVATDAEEILGIGDWGSNGMDISIGKLAVYTAAAGIDPDRVIPVMLDVGTDRESLLNDPLYVGNRHSRVRGERYDQLIAAYIETASRLFPNALLHFEDFGPSNARRILEQYRGKARIFNDDMQGTGAITLAAILAGMRVAGTRPSEQRVVIFGAGTAGVGIADQIRVVMVRGRTERGGGHAPVLVRGQAGSARRRHGRPARLPAGLRPAALRGRRLGRRRHDRPATRWSRRCIRRSSSGPRPWAARSPSRSIREMAKGVRAAADLPAVEPDRADRGSAGGRDQVDRRPRPGRDRNPVGSGPLQGRSTTSIGQANNALVYPGIGLGTIVSRAEHVTDGMLLAASEAIAGLVDVSRPGAGLAARGARTCARCLRRSPSPSPSRRSTTASRQPLVDPVQAVQDGMWQAAYRPLEVK